MTDIDQASINADWDYYNTGQSVISISESRQKLIEVLTSKDDRLGNEKTNQQILELVACIKNDCIVIQRALATDNGEPPWFDDEYDDQTFGEKKEEIRRLFKQLPLHMRNDLLGELQPVSHGV